MTLAAGALAAALAAVPAGAVDENKPEACNGLAYKDPGGDASPSVPEVGTALDYTELLGGFIKYDSAKGPEAVTHNILVKDLKLEVPDGYTSTNWSAYYNTPAGEVRFVRAVLDFSGSLVFEYGQFTAGPEGISGVNQYEGDTNGKMFEGPDGVVQLVIPDGQVKSGDKLDAVYSVAGLGRAMPNAVKSPTRGLSSQMDSAPDDGAAANVSVTVAPCPGGPAPVEAPLGLGSPTQGSTEPTNQPQTGDRALPATLVTKSLRARRTNRSKRFKLKLSSTERLTDLAGQLRKGTKVFGTGKLAVLDGSATMKLKRTKKLRKGKYTLDLAGTDASGKRLLTAASLKVRR